MDIKDFISVEEAVKISGYKKRNITYLCNKGDLPGAVMIGHCWLIPRKSVEEYTPGPQGFAAIKERKIKAELIKKEEQNKIKIIALKKYTKKLPHNYLKFLKSNHAAN